MTQRAIHITFPLAHLVRFLKQINSEVFYCHDALQLADQKWVHFLKKRALQTVRKRARICQHSHVDDPVHEMLIVMHRSNYVRPHKHLKKSVSFYLVSGKMDIILFNDSGKILRRIPMSKKHYFSYRLSKPIFYTIVIHSPWIVYHEVTKGPFLKEESIRALWAPEESDKSSAKQYLRILRS